MCVFFVVIVSLKRALVMKFHWIDLLRVFIIDRHFPMKRKPSKEIFFTNDSNSSEHFLEIISTLEIFIFTFQWLAKMTSLNPMCELFYCHELQFFHESHVELFHLHLCYLWFHYVIWCQTFSSQTDAKYWDFIVKFFFLHFTLLHSYFRFFSSESMKTHFFLEAQIREKSFILDELSNLHRFASHWVGRYSWMYHLYIIFENCLQRWLCVFVLSLMLVL